MKSPQKQMFQRKQLQSRSVLTSLAPIKPCSMPFFHILIATCTCASEDDPHPSSDDSIELWTSDNCISVSMLAPAWGDEEEEE